MKPILLLTLFLHPLFADSNTQLFTLYQQGKYTEGCNFGYSVFSQNKRNEAFVSLLGFSCLKADQVDRLSLVISNLQETPEARANSAYFSLLLMQKKLLMRALYDSKPIQDLRFPTSSHLLSKIFDLYINNPQNNAMIKEYTDKQNPRQSFKLYTTQVNGKKSIAIDEYYDKILTVHHVY
ncbi:hypothetical protein [Sulfuricurvum sp.]|uniref:hypothetical protein n=1 Tax=Sulfuricurvum sp. TaxID=2025608 RepID=UPI002632AE38|nr:hypothetical protein [Sulfuricurvum sp.]MDD2839001.1 hypothetical protein [Sulfuricurvum sp.]MDD3597245.1 hypothetical protein [Sulfuricurvum sp.]